VPLTLLSIKPEDEIAVVEMGANHPGEMAELCQIAQPDYGLITNIGKAHLEGFGTIENIIETKTALYRAARTVFVNVEDEVLRAESRREKAEGGREKGEGRKEVLGSAAVSPLSVYPTGSACFDSSTEAEPQPNEPQPNGPNGVISYGKNTPISAGILEMSPCLVINLFGNILQTQLTGNYNLPNILGAAAIGRFFGVADEDVCDAIAEYIPQNNRSQIIKNESNTIIADYYNANPTSMKAALENLLQIEATQKLAILGDMLELGENSLPEHQAIIDFCKEKKLDAFFIGFHFFTLKNENPHFFTNAQDCNTYLKNNKIENTLILLKASRGTHLEDISLIINH
jgi:UDP-N-acetylmuramoyl-tripeptide--D-alanyl-D-alanine ligase